MQRNLLLSSASEDENLSGRKKRLRVAQRTALHGMHSSVNAGRPQVPLYGRKAAPRTVHEVKFSPKEPPAEQQSTAAASGAKTQSVSDRFKASLQAFRGNRLMKGASATASANSSKLSAALLSQKSTLAAPQTKM